MYIMIVSVFPSSVKHKRYTAKIRLEDGKERLVNFGFRDGSRYGNTWIDGASTEDRSAYWKRHLGNATERKLIENFIISPALLSAYLLWGETRSLETNIKKLNKLLKGTNGSP